MPSGVGGTVGPACCTMGRVLIHRAPRSEVGVMPGGDAWQDSAVPCRCNLCCLRFYLLLREWQIPARFAVDVGNFLGGLPGGAECCGH
jgi:hypothetical protein